MTFEGVDGSGKSTQAELLRDALAADGREVVLTREPGGTDVGERVRELVLNGPDMTPWAEAALFAAARAERVAERFPERIVAFDGARPAEELSEVIRERLRSRI